MVHALVGGGDVARGRVVVGAEVRAPAAAPPAATSARSGTAPSGPRIDCGRLDHELELQGARRAAGPCARARAMSCAAAVTCSGIVTLGSVTTKSGGKRAAVSRGEGGDEEVEGAEAARVELARERLDADADEGRQRARRHALRHLARGARPRPRPPRRRGGCRSRPRSRCGSPRPARARAWPSRGRRRASACPARPSASRQDLRARARTRASASARRSPSLRHGVGLEELGAAVDGVDRLAPGGIARVLARERGVGPAQAGEDRLRDLGRQRRARLRHLGWRGFYRGRAGFMSGLLAYFTRQRAGSKVPESFAPLLPGARCEPRPCSGTMGRRPGSASSPTTE